MKNNYTQNLEFLRSAYPGRISLTVRETAAALGVNIKTAYLIKGLEYKWVSNRKVVTLVDLAKWMASNN